MSKLWYNILDIEFLRGLYKMDYKVAMSMTNSSFNPSALTVIIPIFDGTFKSKLNVTLDSILAQTDIEQNQIKLIVINGINSKSCRKICEKYKETFGDILNMVSIPANNLAKAMNIALPLVETDIFTVINCGDVISDNYLSSGLERFRKTPGADVISTMAYCINKAITTSKVAYLFNLSKYNKSVIIDLHRTPQFFHDSIYACFIKTSTAKELQFNEQLNYDAGNDYIIRLQAKKMALSTVSDCSYSFRMPQEDQFMYYLPAHFKEWYTEETTEFLIPLLSEIKDENGKTPEFVQVAAMFHIAIRFLANLDNRNKRTMNDEELQDFFRKVRAILNLIDDATILNKNKYKILKYSAEAALMFERIKNDGDIDLSYTYFKRNVRINFKDVELLAISTLKVGIHVIEYHNGQLVIDGSFRGIMPFENYKLYASFNGIDYELENNDRYSLTKYFGVSAYKKFTFHLALDLEKARNKQRLYFYAVVNGERVNLGISFLHHWAKLTASPKGAYWRFNEYTAVYDSNTILITKASAKDTFKKEIHFLRNTFPQSKSMFLRRIAYWLTRPYFKNKRIWIMYDKLYKGGDSSEYLYRFCKGNNDGIARYYIIDKNTPDYRKLKKDGMKPLKNHSLKHKMAFLNADIILITNSNTFPFNGYSMEYSRFIRGFCNFSTMCLQHGLTVQKCAMAQQRIVDNTKRYFIASKYEYNNLMHHAYGYKGFDYVRLTGIGRYDGLVSNDQKQILLSPTWRMYNAMPVTTSEGEQRAYNPDFKNTVYYKIYNDLINNEKLIATAKECGYKIKYLLHPIVSAQAKDYTPNSAVEVIPSVGDLSYEKILTESSLMVTDYSGVQFDFAYMKKPLVYFHPTELPAHYDDGCFFYDTMGFGEICTTSEQLVDTLCEYMRQGCKMKQKYIDRVDDFYNFHDHNNCERIYKEIMDYQKIVDKDKMRISK